MTRDNRLLAFSLFVWGLGEGLMYYFRPLYLKQMGADPIAIGSILSLAAMAAGVTHLPAGYLADRLGRKPLLLLGWSLGVVATVIMYLARDLQLFVVGLLAYMFTGFVMVPINSYVAEARGEQSIQRAITLVSAGYWAGNTVSPAIGGLIGQALGLRSVYGLASGLFILSTLMLLPLTPQAPTRASAGSGRYSALFRNQPYLRFVGLMLFAMSAMQLGVPLAPNFVVEVRGLNLAAVGLLGSATSLGAVLLNLAFGQRPPQRGLMISLALAGVYLSLLLTGRHIAWLAVAFFFQASWNLARNMGASQVGRVVAGAEIGLALGLVETMGSLAMIAAPFIAGWLYAAQPALPFQAGLLCVGLALVAVWRLGGDSAIQEAEAARKPGGDSTIQEAGAV